MARLRRVGQNFWPDYFIAFQRESCSQLFYTSTLFATCCKTSDVCRLIFRTFPSMFNYHYLAQLSNLKLSSFLRNQEVFADLRNFLSVKNTDF